MNDARLDRSSLCRVSQRYLNLPGKTVLGKVILAIAAVPILVAAIEIAPGASTDQSTTGRRFTVKDSIEISHIVNPERPTAIVLQEQPTGFPIYSPDDKNFLIVTQRGILSSNSIEGTIWLFEQPQVLKYASMQSSTECVPKRLVSLHATSNTPVIYDVRWVGLGQVAFLGKDNGPNQQLFVVDIETGSLKALTRKDLYVTGYDVNGDTIAYTVLSQQKRSSGFESDVVDAGARNVFELLYRDPPAIEDITESRLLKLASTLHLQKAGREVPVHFVFGSEPLRLFVPTLSLSPDRKFLITVAPVNEVPNEWESYRPLNFDVLRLKSGRVPEKNLMTLESLWRPEQYVIVDLETGIARPLIAAPAGRDLGHSAPSRVFWFNDSRRVIVSNTYLALSGTADDKIKPDRSAVSTVAVVDVSGKRVLASIDLRESLLTAQHPYSVDDIAWDKNKKELTIRYKGEGDDPGPSAETYLFAAADWVKIQDPKKQTAPQSESWQKPFVFEDLNHPPTLCLKRGDTRTPVVLWDPNPKLQALLLGEASVYHWQDGKGRDWSGILLLPPDYDAKRRYPLVIQTHGYDGHRFFSDGAFTTGSGGRALAAKGIIVLQVQDFLAHTSTPEEPLDNIAGFEAAIDQLANRGMVDRTKVGIIGFSRTCFHVLYALTHRPDLFRAATITDGANFSYVEYTMAASRGNQYEMDAEGVNGESPFGEGLTRWTQRAPNFSLDKIQAPLLISAFERQVLLSEWETYVGLRRLRKPVELLWWWKENTPHLLVQPTQRYASQQSAVDWFAFWLESGGESEISRKEYERWRTLRNLQEHNHPN